MKPKLLIVFLLVLLSVATEIFMSSQPPTAETKRMETRINEKPALKVQAPDFTFKTLEGKTRDLSELKGKTVILNFWATWCPPCIKEFPELLELAAKYPGEIVLLAVSVDESPEQIDRFIERLPGPSIKMVGLPNVLIATDPDKKIAQDVFGTVKYPETFIIGPDLAIRHKITGVIDWKSQTVQSLTDMQTIRSESAD